VERRFREVPKRLRRRWHGSSNQGHAVPRRRSPIIITPSKQTNRKASVIKMAIGIIKVWLPQKSYGFISPSAGGQDVFLHISALERAGIDEEQIIPGQAVEFEIEVSPKTRRECAERVRLI
jgi:cold shock protein